MEGRSAAVAGIGERVDDVDELGDAARPAVGDDERHGVGTGRTMMEEVDAEAVDVRAELADLVEPRLEAAPVVAVLPVRDQLREIGEGDALRPPIGAGGRRVGRFPFGQSGCRQSGPQVV